MTRLLKAVRRWYLRVYRPQLTTTEQMEQLFSAESRLRVRYPDPDARWSTKDAGVKW